jgi:hypothetical protein
MFYISEFSFHDHLTKYKRKSVDKIWGDLIIASEREEEKKKKEKNMILLHVTKYFLN